MGITERRQALVPLRRGATWRRSDSFPRGRPTGSAKASSQETRGEEADGPRACYTLASPNAARSPAPMVPEPAGQRHLGGDIPGAQRCHDGSNAWR